MRCPTRIYWTEGKKTLVLGTDPRANQLAFCEGQEIPNAKRDLIAKVEALTVGMKAKPPEPPPAPATAADKTVRMIRKAPEQR